MKLGHILRAAIPLALFAMAAMPAHKDEVLLRRELKPQARDTYRLETMRHQVVTLPNSETRDDTISIGMDCTFKTGSKVEDERVPIEIEFSKFKFQPENLIPNKDLPKKVKLSGWLNEMNELTELSTSKAKAKEKQLAASALQMLQRVQQAWTFPEDPVEPGETWEVSLPLIPGGEEKDIVFQMKFEGEEEMGDKRYWKLSAKDSVPIRVDLGAQGNDAGSMTVRGDIEIKMQLLFERSGRLFSQLSEMRSDLTIDYSRATGKMKVVEDTVSRWTSLNRPKSTKGA